MLMKYFKLILGMIFFVVLSSFVFSTTPEYLSPCSNGTRMDETPTFDICGNSAFTWISSEFINLTSCAPITPNSKCMNLTTSNSELLTNADASQYTSEKCIQMWINPAKTQVSSGGNCIFGWRYMCLGWGTSDGDLNTGNTSMGLYVYNGTTQFIPKLYTRAMPPNQWYAVAFHYKLSYTTPPATVPFLINDLWINGVLQWNSTLSNVYITAAKKVVFGSGSLNENDGFIGAIDHLVVYNGGCNSSMIGEFAGLINVSSATPVYLNYSTYDRSNNLITVSNVDETSFFEIRANYTIDDKQVSSAVCTYEDSNMTNIFTLSTGNYTFMNSSASVSLIASETNNNGYQDIIVSKFCDKLGSSGNIDFYINNTLIQTVDNTDIPLCSNGFQEFKYNSTLYKTNDSINITFKCSNCNAGNQVKIFSLNNYNDIILLKREKRPYTAEALTYNATSKLYESDEYHSWLQSGTYNLSVSCTNNSINNISYSLLYTVSNPAPVSSLISITDVNNIKQFTNGTVIEAGNITILGECSGDIISFKQMNVTYQNGTLIKSVNDEKISLSNSEININGIYNVSLLCKDDDVPVNTSMTIKYFQLNDTVSPFIVWLYPNVDNSTTIYNNNVFSSDIIFTDENLYSVNLSCSSDLGLNVLNENKIVYPNNIYQMINTSSNITYNTVVTCTATATDYHTMNDISKENINANYLPSLQTVLFHHKNTELNISLKGYSLDYIKLELLKDRYTFEPINLDSKIKELIYEVECSSELKLLNYSKYPANFICDNFWIDFDIDGKDKIKDYEIIKITKNKFRVVIKNIKSGESLKTKSVGIVNTVSSDVSLTVIDYPEETPSFSTISIGTVLFLFLVFFIWLFFMIGGILLKNNTLGAVFIPMYLIIGIVFGILLLNYSLILSFVIILFSLGIVIAIMFS